jgi:small subunit ribosomal protein S1
VKAPKAAAPKSAPTSTSNQADRGATLGDLDALAALKEQMEGRS